MYAAWKQWDITNTQYNAADEDMTSSEDVTQGATKPEDKEYLKKNKGSYYTMNILCIITVCCTCTCVTLIVS